MAGDRTLTTRRETTGATVNDEPRPPAAEPGGEARPRISAQGLRKSFGKPGPGAVHALDGVSLDVRAGEFVVLLGPSGCGKTTLLRSIAGLETPESGEIVISDRTVYSSSTKVNVPSERRGINMMFQSYALWPHMTVFDNVAYPLRSHRVSKAETAPRVERLLGRIGIAELASRYPSELSGGQQQRVALARALAVDPSCVMFDEPLSNVDAKVREQLRVELVQMHQRMGFSAVYVTHDQVEAMQLADRLVVMRRGSIEQQGTPEEIYRFPRTRYVANFIGQCNELEGEVRTVRDGRVTVATASGDVEVEQEGAWSPGDAVVAIIRLEDLRVLDGESSPVNRWTATVRTRMFAGSTTEYVTAVGGDRVLRVVVDGHRRALAEGTEVALGVDPGAVRIVPQEPREGVR